MHQVLEFRAPDDEDADGFEAAQKLARGLMST